MDYRLRKHETVSAGCQRIACEEIAAVLQDLHACALAEDPAKSIHDARKHLKKLRALVRLLRPAIGDEAYLRETGCFRRAAGRLAGARDAEVCVQTIGEIRKEAPREIRKALDKARAHFSSVLDRHRAPPHRTLDAIGASLVAAAASIRDWSFDGGDSHAPGKGMKRLFRRARKAATRAAETPSVACLHAWRRCTKELWAALHLTREVGGKHLRRLAGGSRKLGEVLGKDHDLAVLKESLFREHAAAGLDEEALAGLERLIETQRAQFQRQAWKLGSRCYGEKPRKFAKHFLAGWEQWRA